MNWKIVLVLLAAFSLTTMCAEVAFGQGGTGRELGNSNANKGSKPTRTSTTPSRRNPRSSETPAENTASLEETLNWIGERLTESASYNIIVGNFGLQSNFNEIFHDLPGSPSYKVDGCTVTMERAYTTNNETTYKGSLTLVIPFGDINPLTVKRDGSSLNMRAVHATPKMIQNSTRVSDPAVRFEFKTEEDAKSLERAINHAVKLCGGGKPSKF